MKLFRILDPFTATLVTVVLLAHSSPPVALSFPSLNI
ncbi:bile acid/Na+ symporter family transporter [Klebsiella variicola]|nr:bile acid/Na+ symporter family transporter [Klebsiella variicola]